LCRFFAGNRNPHYPLPNRTGFAAIVYHFNVDERRALLPRIDVEGAGARAEALPSDTAAAS
jgi:hypothetical protein